MTAKPLDLLVWGATGFTGRLVAEYIASRYGDSLAWGIGGRDQETLERIRSSLRDKGGAVDLVVADSRNAAEMEQLAQRTRVVCSTVGPYARFGSPLVEACTAQGTHYCDITGEPQWIRKMIDAHEQKAQDSGARIVHCCGFDSIPSDLGVWFLQEQFKLRTGQPCDEIKLRVRKLKGAASGGTAASLVNLIVEAKADRNIARVLVDPYGLNPTETRRGPDDRDQSGPRFDPDVNAWTAPFVMAAINGKVVRRSNALMNFAYGEEFQYSEAVTTGRGLRGWLRAAIATGGLAGLVAGARFELSRKLLEKYVLPKPGSGPSESQRENGYFELILVGKTAGNPTTTLRGRIRGKRDPGYGATCRMLGESALCLAQDDLTVGGGFWTRGIRHGSAAHQPVRRKCRYFTSPSTDTQSLSEKGVKFVSLS